MPLKPEEAEKLLSNVPPKWLEFTYRGHTLKELLTMPLDELAKIAPARIRRKMLRFLNGNGGLTMMERRLFEKIKKFREHGIKKPIKTHCRDFPILPEFIGMRFLVHNGKEFVEIHVTPWHIFNRLGDFAPTIKFVQHGGVKKAKAEKKE